MATFIDKEGSIFESGADVLVCPVNCIPGVMGKGLALEFAKRWPELKSAHRHACQAVRHLRPGMVTTTGVGAGVGRVCIMFFPTKHHWGNPSKIEYIRDGLADMRRWGDPPDPFKSFAIPAIGCGLGGLRWEDVRPLIVEALAPLDITVMLYAPKVLASGRGGR